MANFFDFSPTSTHLHPLQVENCDSNSRLVVDEDDNDKFRLERVKGSSQKFTKHCWLILTSTISYYNLWQLHVGEHKFSYKSLINVDANLSVRSRFIKHSNSVI